MADDDEVSQPAVAVVAYVWLYLCYWWSRGVTHGTRS
jgi:hypothetical protein